MLSCFLVTLKKKYVLRMGVDSVFVYCVMRKKQAKMRPQLSEVFFQKIMKSKKWIVAIVCQVFFFLLKKSCVEKIFNLLDKHSIIPKMTIHVRDMNRRLSNLAFCISLGSSIKSSFGLSNETRCTSSSFQLPRLSKPAFSHPSYPRKMYWWNGLGVRRD